jgi:hypothetical protein
VFRFFDGNAIARRTVRDGGVRQHDYRSAVSHLLKVNFASDATIGVKNSCIPRESCREASLVRASIDPLPCTLGNPVAMLRIARKMTVQSLAYWNLLLQTFVGEVVKKTPQLTIDILRVKLVRISS